MAFLGTARGGILSGNRRGIWSGAFGQPGLLKLIAYQGSSAPGGGTFADFVSIALPDQGGVVFLARISGVSGALAGIYAVDTNGVLQLIVREGQVHPANSKVIRTLQFLNNSMPTAGQTRHFAASTEDLTYTATFADRSSGIYRMVFP